MLVEVCRVLVVVGCRSLSRFAAFWLSLVVDRCRCVLFGICGLLFVVVVRYLHFVLFAVCCLLVVVRWLLSVVSRSLFVCMLANVVVCWLLLVACGLWCVGWCRGCVLFV